MSPLEEAFGLIAQRAEADPELAAALRTVLSGMLEMLPEPVPEPLPIPEPASVFSPAVEEAVAYPSAALEDTEPGFTQWPDLDVVAVRLGLKAKAARWVARYGYTEQSEALGERREILEQARAMGCFVWLFDRNRIDPGETEMLNEIADLFELTTRCLTLWQDAGGTAEEVAADQLLAEMQAALRDQALKLAGNAAADQFALYRTLKLNAQASRTYLPQLSLSYRSQNVEVLGAELSALHNAQTARKQADLDLERVRGKVQRCVHSVVGSPSYIGRWRKLEGALAELLELGGEMPQLDDLSGLELPDDLPLIRQALTKPEVLVDQREVESPNPVAEDSAEVEQVRALLSGHVVLIVGGDCRPEAVRRLESAFHCSVCWLETAPHTSLDVLEPAITGEVAVVLLLIRWSSHVYQELSHACKVRAVPLVRVSGGYSPNRVAHDVLEQARDRLRTLV